MSQISIPSSGGSLPPEVATEYVANTGSAVPADNILNVLGDGSITTIGSGDTLTIELTGLTNHSVLVGAGTTTITKVGPTATAGQVLQSAGSSADPAFSTATYPSTTTANQILYSSSSNTVGQITTSNNGVLVTSNSGVPSFLANSVTAGFVLKANSGAPPSWQSIGAFSSINVQVFTSGGTYTPTTGMLYCIIEVVGGGGGSGGVAATDAITNAASAGGGGGGYARGIFSSATIGVSQSVTIGAGGTAGTAGNNSGGTGGTTSVGALISATGGVGGAGSAAVGGGGTLGGAGGTGSGGDFGTHGAPGGYGFGATSAGIFTVGFSGSGGSSFFGGGAPSNTGPGIAGVSYGGGASGTFISLSSSAAAGAAGAAGVVIITEFI